MECSKLPGIVAYAINWLMGDILERLAYTILLNKYEWTPSLSADQNQSQTQKYDQ